MLSLKKPAVAWYDFRSLISGHFDESIRRKDYGVICYALETSALASIGRTFILLPGIGQAETVPKTLVFEPVACQCAGRTHGHLVAHKSWVDIREDQLLDLFLDFRKERLHSW